MFHFNYTDPVFDEKSTISPRPKSRLPKWHRNKRMNETEVRVYRQTFIGSAEAHGQQTISKPKMILFYNPLAYQLTRGILTKAKYFMENCQINNCVFEFDHKLVNSSDAVIFNSIRELDLHDKRPGQTWIMLQWESLQSHIENAHPRAPVYQRGRVNWTMGYSKKADIYLPYGVARRLPQQNRPHRNYSQISNRKTKDAVWIVSHCETSSKREIYVSILKKYISVDILGYCGKKWNCGQKLVHDRCFDILNDTYRYYLAFENSLCENYVTEKFFENYKYDIIQVARFGGKHSSVIDLSKRAYISTNDFKNAHKLGKFLRQLSADPEAYATMLRSKDAYEITLYMELFRNAACEMCKRLHSVDKYSSVYDYPFRWMQETQTCYDPYDL